jgi:hypothetical protein
MGIMLPAAILSLWGTTRITIPAMKTMMVQLMIPLLNGLKWCSYERFRLRTDCRL